jgi:hypothetical protein
MEIEMQNPREALDGVLSSLQPRDRLPFLRYLTRKGEWAGDRRFLVEIAACRDRLAGVALAAGAEGMPSAPGRPALRLDKD